MRNAAVIAATDFQVLGFVVTLDLDTFEVSGNLAEVSSDPVPRVFDGRIYAVNRFNFDNIQIIDPEAGFGTVAQFSTGNGSNPHDIVVVGNEAFISRYEPPFNDVLVMDLTNGSTLATIDLLPFADTATDPAILPRPHLMAKVDGRILVMLQHFDPTFSIVGRGSIVVLDPTTRTVVSTIDLGAINPNALVSLDDGVWVSLSGLFFPNMLNGGIARVDSSSSNAVLIADDDAFGGNLGSLAIVSEGLGYVIVTEFDDVEFTSVGRVRQFDPRTGEVGNAVLTCNGFTPELGFDGGDRLVVLCRDVEHPGAYVIDAPTGEVLAGPIDTGLPPIALSFLQ